MILCIVIYIYIYIYIYIIYIYAHIYLYGTTLLALLVKLSVLRVEDLGFISGLRRGDFSGWSHTSDLKIGTPVATMPGMWHYVVNTGTGLVGYTVTIL